MCISLVHAPYLIQLTLTEVSCIVVVFVLFQAEELYKEHYYIIIIIVATVKPLNKGHIGDGPVVPCREVVLFSEVFF